MIERGYGHNIDVISHMRSLTSILLNVAPMLNVTYLMYVVRTGRATRADDDDEHDDGGSELEVIRHALTYHYQIHLRKR